MSSAQVFFTQVAMSVLVYALLALWYVVPSLARLPRNRALMPPLVLHTFRTIGLVFIVPGVVGPRMPAAFATPAAYGDLLAATLALAALLTLRAGWRAGIVLVWLFSLEGTADLLYGIFQGAQVKIWDGYALGSAWYLLTFIVPALLVTHALIFWLLLRPQRTAGTTLPSPSTTATPIPEHIAQPHALEDAHAR